LLCKIQGRSRRERRSTAGLTKRFEDCVTAAAAVPALSPRSAAKKKKAGAPPAVVKRNAVGETPLHQAAKRGDAVRVTDLLRKGADPNIPDHAGAVCVPVI
jgi:ankyrin repeat protein